MSFIKTPYFCEIIGQKDLIFKVKLTCEKYGISVLKHIFYDYYSRDIKNNFTK